MTGEAEFRRNRATEGELANHLSLCDATFVPSLSSRVEIPGYAHKLWLHATRFEAWADGLLVGLVAVYCNDSARRFAYVTSVSVLPEGRGRRIASGLLVQCSEYLRALGFERVELEVDRENQTAIQMYHRHGFIAVNGSGRNLVMHLTLGGETTDEPATGLQRRNQ
jgi:ribosomal protein S18 acetylase RimI-like enzyme